jgi:hypothetical protein
MVARWEFILGGGGGGGAGMNLKCASRRDMCYIGSWTWHRKGCGGMLDVARIEGVESSMYLYYNNAT